MPATYEPIATATMNGFSASATFANIPQTYTDLRLTAFFTGVAGCNFSTRVGNGGIDTAANYNCTRLYGTGGVGVSNRNSDVDFLTANITVGASGSNSVIDIMNYTNTATYKAALHRFNDGSSIVFAVAGMWRSSSAITHVRIYSTNSVDFANGTVFTLYGIKAA